MTPLPLQLPIAPEHLLLLLIVVVLLGGATIFLKLLDFIR